jgi:hypothetical protein
MKAKLIVAFATSLNMILVSSAHAQQGSSPYLGMCDPKRQRGEYYKYQCQRNDGSIGWLEGTRIGYGRPIIEIHGRNTDNAYMLTRQTTRYPGYACYYDEPNGLNSPSRKCIDWVRRASLMKPEKVQANCPNMVVLYENGQKYKYWTKDSYSLYWLPPGSRPIYDENRSPQGMPGGTDEMITEAFRILCPSKFDSVNGPLPYRN